MSNKSFTLIELLVVIVIIGILAGVIMISTSSSIDKANIAKSKVFEESVQNNLAANMVSRWKLDEIIGAAAPYTTPDQWGSNTGTLYGTNGLPQLRPASECVTGGCFKFDGVDDYIDFGSSITPQLLSASVSFWRRQDSLSNWLLFKGQSSSEYIMATSGGTGNFYHGNSGGGKTIYKDGVISIAPAIDYAWHYYVISDVNLSSWTSIVLNNYSTWHYKGYIDDIRIYSASLSFTQIKQNYIAGLDSLLSKNLISREEYSQRLSKLSLK